MMAKFSLRITSRHYVIEAARRERKRRKSRRDKPDVITTPSPSYRALNILFYGKEAWYRSQAIVLNLKNTQHTHAEFDKPPANLDTLDVIIVDCIEEEGSYLALDFLKRVARTGRGPSICLSYNDKNNISDLLQDVKGFFPARYIQSFRYPEISRMQIYIDHLKAKRG